MALLKTLLAHRLILRLESGHLQTQVVESTARIPEPSWGAVVWAMAVGLEDRHTGYLVTGISAQGR